MAMDSLFDRALATARQLGASDIHLKPGMEPILRIDGELRTLRNPDVPPMTRDFLHNLAMSLLNDRRRDILERHGDVTVALTTSGGARQRVHVSQHRGGMTISLHLVPSEPPQRPAAWWSPASRPPARPTPSRAWSGCGKRTRARPCGPDWAPPLAGTSRWCSTPRWGCRCRCSPSCPCRSCLRRPCRRCRCRTVGSSSLTSGWAPSRRRSCGDPGTSSGRASGAR